MPRIDSRKCSTRSYYIARLGYPMVFRYRCSNWDTHHEHPLASWQGPFGPHSPKLCQAAQMSLTPNFVWKVCSHRGASSLSQKTRHVSTDWWLVCVCARALPTTTPSSKKINPGWWLRYEAHPKSQDIPSRIILEYFGGTLGSPSGNISASGCLSSAPAPGAGVKNVALYNWKSRAFWSYLYLNILNRTN